MIDPKNHKTLAIGIALLVLPLVLQQFGNAWVRIADMALLYVLLAVGLNIVVGYAGLLDLGFADELQRVLALLPAKRQTLLFSATFAPEVNSWAKAVR